MKKITTGRDVMSDFAPKIAQLNDDTLFGSVKNNSPSETEISEALTQLAFYAGWPKAWAALRIAKEVYHE